MYGKEYLEAVEAQAATVMLADAFKQVELAITEKYGEECWSRITAELTLGCRTCMAQNQRNALLQEAMMRQQQAAFGYPGVTPPGPSGGILGRIL